MISKIITYWFQWKCDLGTRVISMFCVFFSLWISSLSIFCLRWQKIPLYQVNDLRQKAPFTGYYFAVPSSADFCNVKTCTLIPQLSYYFAVPSSADFCNVKTCTLIPQLSRWWCKFSGMKPRAPITTFQVPYSTLLSVPSSYYYYYYYY